MNDQQSDWSLNKYQVEKDPAKVRFHEFDLPLPLMQAIADLEYQYCSPIQAQTLPYTLAGLDLIGQAQTGTGKTAAFLITTIKRLLEEPYEGERFAGEPRALVLAPTRELVMQIAKDAEGFTKHTDLNVMSVVGGIDYQKQRNQLTSSVVDILVATPGRLIDFLKQRSLNLQDVDVLILDEADRMLDMGFIPDVRRIIRQTPKKEFRQTLLFSATFNEDVMYLANQWTIEPEMVIIEPESVATETVEQKVYILTQDQKYPLLRNLIQTKNLNKLIVFANRRDETRDLFHRLRKDNISCAMISGEIPQHKRIKTLDQFKNGRINVLIATDVAGRGIHIEDISHVVNYSLPEDPEDYVHRIGRTGRAGKTGISISFACEDDAFQIPAIEELLGEKLECTHPEPELLDASPQEPTPSS